MLLCYSCLDEALRVQAAQSTIDDGASMFSLLPHLFFFSHISEFGRGCACPGAIPLLESAFCSSSTAVAVRCWR